jgi:hypothetical protein
VIHISSNITKDVAYLTTNNNITYEMKDHDINKTNTVLTNNIYNNEIYSASLHHGHKCSLLANGTIIIYNKKTNHITQVPKINNIIFLSNLSPSFTSKVQLIMLNKYGEIYYYINDTNISKEMRLENEIIVEIIVNGHKIYALDSKNIIHIINTDNSNWTIDNIKLKDSIDDIW